MLSAPVGPCSQIWPLSQLPLHPSSRRSWYRSFNTAPGPQTWGETGSHHCTATKVRLAPILHLNLKLSPPAITSRVLFLGHIFCTCVPLGQVKVTQLCLTLWNPKGYTVHGILQARILEWIANPFSRGSSQPRDWTQVSCIAGGFFTSWATREEALVASPLPFLIGDLPPDLRSEGLPLRERTDFLVISMCHPESLTTFLAQARLSFSVSLPFWVLICLRIIDWTSRNFQYLSPLCNQIIQMRVNGMLEACIKSDHCNQFYWGSLAYQ